MRDGDLNNCAYCGYALRVVDGTDPENATPDFWEKYECVNGHRGWYEYERGRELFYGACRET